MPHKISGHNIQSAIITLGKDTKKPFIATVDNGTFGGGSNRPCNRSGISRHVSDREIQKRNVKALKLK